MDGRKIIQRGLIGLAVATIIGYSYFVLDDFIRGPRIIIESPLDGYSTTTPAIVVVGRGIHTNNLSINDSLTAVDLDGNFRGQLILAPGYNIIKVTAKDNYERVVEKTIEMVLVIPVVDTSVSTTTTATSTETHEITPVDTEAWVEGAITN